MKSICCLIPFLIGVTFVLTASYWFRQPSPDDHDNTQRNPIYDQIIIYFFDATGYRYIDGTASQPIFQTLTSLKYLRDTQPNSTFLVKTMAQPPSTDFTILSIINGVKQMSNYLDIIFKTSPSPSEASLLKKPLKSALFSSKKMDWFKMSSGEFTFVENSQVFELQNIQQADHSSFQYFQKIFNAKQYQFQVCHFMGFDALGHALQYQDYSQGIHLLSMYNKAVEWIVQRLEPNQLLIILGDHDQSYRGKHYQCSEESLECEGFIFAYRKNGLYQYNHHPKNYEPSDISATMHALFGYDTSNQNMGKLIPQLYPQEISLERIRFDQEMVRERMVRHLKNQGSQFPQEYLDEVSQLDSVNSMEIMQDNFRFGRPDKLYYFIGIVLITISMIPLIKELIREKDKQIRIQNTVYIGILMLAQQIGKYFYIILLIAEQDRQLSISKKILKIMPLLLILFGTELIQYIPIEFLFMMCLFAKYWTFQHFKFLMDLKVFSLMMLALFSQVLVYIFYIIDRIDFSIKQFIAICMICNLLIFCFIDPRYFNKGKIKTLYIVLLFLLADLSVIFQLSSDYTFTQFILFFGFMRRENPFFNLILAKLISGCINPIMIPHSYYKNQTQVNMNALIILVREFEVGPSLLSIFLGYYGIFIIALSTSLIQKQKTNKNAILILALYFQFLINSLNLLLFNHSLNSDAEEQIFTLYKLPINFMEFLLNKIFWLIQ